MSALKDHSPQQLRHVMFDIRWYKENIAQTLGHPMTEAHRACLASATKRKAEREEKEECLTTVKKTSPLHSRNSIEFGD